MKSIVVISEGGSISKILSHEKLNAIIIDRDIDDVDPSDLKVIQNEKVFVYEELTEVDPFIVNGIMVEIGIEPEQHTSSAEQAYINEAVDEYIDMQAIAEDVSPEQLEKIRDGVQNWLSQNIEDVIAESVSNIVY